MAMRPASRDVLLLVAALLLISPVEPAHAEIRYIHSIEWLTDVVESIGRYRAESVSAVVEESDGWQSRRYRVDAVLVESLKGKAPTRVSFDIRVTFRDSTAAEVPEVTKGMEFVLFQVPNAEREDRRVLGLYCLDEPYPTGRTLTARPRTKSCDVLMTREAILDAIRTRVEYNRESDRELPPVGFDPLPSRSGHQGKGYVWLWPPDGKRDVSGYYLLVPADPDVKKYLLGQLESKRLRDRAGAARRLGVFPGEETVRALKSLLGDPETQERLVYFRDEDEFRRVPVYPVRLAAYFALRQLGVDVEPPEGSPEDLSYLDRFW